MVSSSGLNVCCRCGKLYLNGEVTVEYELTITSDIFCDKCYISFLRNLILLGKRSDQDEEMNKGLQAMSKLRKLKHYILLEYDSEYIKETRESFGELWDETNEAIYLKEMEHFWSYPK
jgi:hypothetical protein